MKNVFGNSGNFRENLENPISIIFAGKSEIAEKKVCAKKQCAGKPAPAHETKSGMLTEEITTLRLLGM